MTNETALRERMKKITSDPERRLVLARLIDHWATSVYNYSFTSSLILGESNRALATTLFATVKENPLNFWGAYPEAKRVLACFLPDYLDESLLPQLCSDDLAIIRCSYAPASGLSHRDFLGSLVGLGIMRDCIGDILPDDENGRCDIILSRSILPLILLEYRQAGRSTLSLEEITADALNLPEQAFRIITASVASLRLDAILAVAFKMARTDAVNNIHSGRVLVNGFSVEKADYKLNEGDSISCRGSGKCRLNLIKGKSRKDRIMIDLSIYL